MSRCGRYEICRFRKGMSAVTAAVVLCIGFSHPLLAAVASWVKVEYEPPHLSVEAGGVSLPQLLREIGAKVGFAVLDSGIPRPATTVSIKHATLAEVLRQLLRGENQAIVYQEHEEGQGEAGAVIAKIVLFGPQASAEAILDQGERQQVATRHADITASQEERRDPFRSPPLGLSVSPSFAERERTSAAMLGGENPAATVDRLLKAHALPGMQSLTADMPVETWAVEASQPWESPSGPVGEDATSGMLTRGFPLEIEETLAMTTQLAQQNLRGLIDGLTTATHSFLSSLADPDR